MRTAAVVVLVVAPSVGACRDPTQVTLTVRTNAVCDDVDGTSITAGQPGQLELRDPVAATTACTSNPDGGYIGSLVLIPGDADDGLVGLKVAASLGGQLDDCLKAPYGETCIVARRSLRYIPHTPLTLPVTLDVDCVGTFCTELTTCLDGACVDATVDPNDCVGPAGCDIAGGAGGGAPDCGPPATTAAIAIRDVPVDRAHLAIAADPDSCGWAVAWSEVSTETCTALIGKQGAPLGEVACLSRGSIADVDVTALGAGVFAVADWGDTPPEARLSTATADGVVVRSSLGDAAGGALAVRGDTLLMVYHPSDGTLRYATYAWDGSSLSPPTQSPLAGATGSGIDVAWGADDAVVSWLSSAGGGNVMRLPIGDGAPGTPVAVPTITNIAVAHHAPSGVTGIIFNDANGNGELATWSPTGAFTSGGASAVDYSGTAERFAITGTTTGWVVAFIDEGRGLLTSFDAAAQYILTVRVVADDATTIAIAAIGDQLGVAWIDARGVLWFRRVAFDLSTL